MRDVALPVHFTRFEIRYDAISEIIYGFYGELEEALSGAIPFRL